MRLFLLKYGLLCLILLPVCLQAQDVKVLAGEVENLFKGLRPVDRKVLVEGYIDAFTSSVLSQQDKDKIDTVFKELQDLRVTVIPELRNYIASVNAFHQRSERANLQVWLDGLKEVLAASERKRTLVKNYLELTVPMACEQILFNGAGYKWMVKGKVKWSSGTRIRLDGNGVELSCVTPKDSIVVYNTDITNLLGTTDLAGRNGMVRWEKAADSLTIKLTNYRVDLKMSEYTADSVWLDAGAKYGQPILGRLRDNALKYQRGIDTPFPDFSSYDTDLKIPALFQDISFKGGINYVGNKFFGFGKEEQLAMICIAPSDTLSMSVFSRRFSIDTLRILAGSAALVVSMDSGEISHPDINFSYMYSKNTVTVKRITEQSLHLPFKDTYHQILFDVEEMDWPLDSTYIEMKMSSRSGLFQAVIESLNYFSEDVYDQIQGLDEINPLNGLLQCSMRCGSDVFAVGEYAGYLKKPADQLRKQIVLLSYRDFVDYNEAKDEVRLKQRLYDYTRARVGKQDYDDIRFISHPKDGRINAMMDVRNYSLKIMGVEKFIISKKKNIYVQPSDNRVTMLRNRDMEFNGKLNAGMFDMYGQNLFFSYDKYAIDLNKVDSTSMYLAGRNKHLRGEKIKSLIRDISGEIVIDKPDNKSGKNEHTGYPVLNSAKESYVYFDDPDICNGEYKRDSFYYVIKPYTIKGIDDVSQFRYAFDGTLHSNIVEPIHDTLKLMEDNALGLTYRTPTSGIDLYGKGRIRSTITLDRNGFLANGEVKLNRSNFQADTIVMLPTRMLARTDLLKVDSVPGQRPGMNGANVKITYLARLGNLQATSIGKSFDLYKGQIKHTGTVFVYENLMDAAGKLELKDATLTSGLFNLRDNNILSQKTTLKISSIANEDVQLNTSDVQADINLTLYKGKFINNAEANRAVFSGSRYACTFKSFTWYMKEAYLNIGIEDEKELTRIWGMEDTDSIPVQGKNIFVATDPAADSLLFIAPLARYNLQNGDIDCRWINHVDIANGRFYPEQGNIFVNGVGGIRELKGGRLLCERNDSTKLLTNVTLRLQGRYRFNGEGDFDYISEENKRSVIHFSEIHTDTLKLIYTKAIIQEKQPLLLNDGFRYKGNVILHSRQGNLFFRGYAGLTCDSAYLKHRWLAVDHYLDSKHIRIPVQAENRNDKNQRIYNGIFLYTDKVFKPYASFMSNRLFYNDNMLLGGKGDLAWSGSIGQYVISDTLLDRYYHFRYDPSQYKVSAFGKITMNMDIPGITSNMVGGISYLLKEEELNISNAMYLMDFKILSKMDAVLLNDFGDKKLKSVSVNPELMEKIYTIYGKQQMPLVEKQLKRSTANVPDSLNRMLVLDSLDFKWNKTTKSYVASGQAVVKMIGYKPVDKLMNIKMELLPKRSGDQIFIYIYNDKMWYYFECSDDCLYTLSSNTEYNEILRAERADRKVVQTKEKESLYTITLCPDSKKERFLKRVQ